MSDETRGDRLGAWRQTLAWSEPWYGAYALLGAVVAGLIPILLPLQLDTSAGAAALGAVMAALNAGMLSAPLWGALADRQGRHRAVFVFGLALIAGGLLLFPLAQGLLAWSALALVLGSGSAATSTVASLFIVERHPQAEWDARIGGLQWAYGAGQVSGLVLAGLVHAHPSVGLWLAAALMAPALGFAARLPRPAAPALPARPALPRPSAGFANLPVASPHYHHLPNLRALKRVWGLIRAPFGRFLLAWFLTCFGAVAFFAFYPLLMREVYGLGPDLASWGYAGLTVLGLTLFGPAAVWSQRFGAARVLRSGYLLRLAAFVGLGALVALHAWGLAAPLIGGLALAGFGAVVLAWSLLSVASSALAASLSALPQGEALGAFNAVTALAGIGGAVAGGLVTAQFGGYGSLPWLAAACTLVGLALANRRPAS